MKRLFTSPIFWGLVTAGMIYNVITDPSYLQDDTTVMVLVILAVGWGVYALTRKAGRKRNRKQTPRPEGQPVILDPPRGDGMDLTHVITLSPLTARNRYDRLKDYTVVDLETTGLDPKTDAVVELSAVRFRDFKPVDSFSTLVNPGCHIPSRATQIHKITDDMVADKPIFAQVLPDFVAFVGTDTIVSHNLKFDMRFLAVNGFNAHNRKYFDTLKLARQVLKYGEEIENHKLGTLCQHYNIPLTNAHRSEADCTATGYLFACLAEEITGGN